MFGRSCLTLKRGPEMGKPLRIVKNRNGQLRNPNWIMQSGKCIWTQLCRAKRSCGVHPALRQLELGLQHPTRVAKWKVTNPRERVTKRSRRSYRRQRAQLYDTTTIWRTSLFRCHKRWKSQMQRQQWTRNGNKLETVPEWQLDEVQNKEEVILEAQKKQNQVHFASFMDICHLKKMRRWNPNSRSAKVKDSGINGGRKSNGCRSTATRMWWTSSWCSICCGNVFDVINGRSLGTTSKIQRFLLKATYTETTPGTHGRDSSKKHWWNLVGKKYLIVSCSSWKEFIWSPFGRTVVGMAVWISFTGTWMGKIIELGMSICSPKTLFILIGIRGWHQHFSLMLNLTNRHHFLITYMWNALNVIANWTNLLSTVQWNVWITFFRWSNWRITSLEKLKQKL